MGYYLNPLPTKGKADYLLEVFGANEIEQPSDFAPYRDRLPMLVCVVENPGFDAAALVYDGREFQDFIDPNDPRPKRWVEIGLGP